MKLTTTLLGALLLSGSLAIAQRPGQRPQSPQRPGQDSRPSAVSQDNEGDAAQHRPGPGPGPRMGRDPMMEHLFPPPLIMENAEKIKLTEEQKNSIKAEMEKSREQVEPLQKKLREEIEELTKLLKPAHVDETAALAQLDKVLAAEAEMKKAHLGTLIRLKNILTEEQQEQLRKLMREHRRFGPRDNEDGPRRNQDGPNEGGPRGNRDGQNQNEGGSQDNQRTKPARPTLE